MLDSRLVDVPHIKLPYHTISILCLLAAILASILIARSLDMLPVPSHANRIFFTGITLVTYTGSLLSSWLLFKRSIETHLIFSGFFISFFGLLFTLITIWQYPPLAISPAHFLYLFFLVTALQLSFVFFLYKKQKNKKFFILFPITISIIFLFLYFFFDQIYLRYFVYVLIGYIVANLTVSLAKPLHIPLVTPRETE